MAKIVGTEKSERLDGTSGNDRIYGLDDDDQIYGGAGDDLLVGGDDNDRIFDTLGSVTIEAGAGNDPYDDDDFDLVRYQNPHGGLLTLDLGTGNGELQLYSVQAGGRRSRRERAAI